MLLEWLKNLVFIPKNSIGINMLRLTYWHWGNPLWLPLQNVKLNIWDYLYTQNK
jgi:hypothetical protein